jgi:hypothetical protein
MDDVFASHAHTSLHPPTNRLKRHNTVKATDYYDTGSIASCLFDGDIQVHFLSPLSGNLLRYLFVSVYESNPTTNERNVAIEIYSNTCSCACTILYVCDCKVSAYGICLPLVLLTRFAFYWTIWIQNQRFSRINDLRYEQQQFRHG